MLSYFWYDYSPTPIHDPWLLWTHVISGLLEGVPGYWAKTGIRPYQCPVYTGIREHPKGGIPPSPNITLSSRTDLAKIFMIGRPQHRDNATESPLLSWTEQQCQPQPQGWWTQVSVWGQQRMESQLTHDGFWVPRAEAKSKQVSSSTPCENAPQAATNPQVTCLYPSPTSQPWQLVIVQGSERQAVNLLMCAQQALWSLPSLRQASVALFTPALGSMTSL